MWTRDFLRELAHGDAAQLPTKELRAQALALLRHFPLRGDIELAHLIAPDWFGSTSLDDNSGGDSQNRSSTSRKRT
ncbi:hypothetical protein ASD35_25390 [Pelomonas sp. Root1444]|nr:hypothetical protein ASD35_25390 [Pelomonas sp. Root1444]